MSQRTRTGKLNAGTSTTKSRRKPATTQKVTRTNTNSIQKKTSSPSKTNRPKRLSGLTASTLLQYCTNIRSPTSNDKNSKNNKNPLSPSPIPEKTSNKRKRTSSKQSNKPNQSESQPVTRLRREASSRASAMIMQHNEIERSRFNYKAVEEIPTQRRPRPKSPMMTTENFPEPLPLPSSFEFNVPPPPAAVILAPSVTNTPNHPEHPPPSNTIPIKPSNSSLSKHLSNNCKYPVLTEALLAEHNRLLGTIPSYHSSKRDNLLKWTRELKTYDHQSPPSIDYENSVESLHDNSSSNLSTTEKSKYTLDSSKPRSISNDIHVIPITESSRGFPSNPSANVLHPLSRSLSFSFGHVPSTYPIDLRSFYPLLPCWQYPGKPLND